MLLTSYFADDLALLSHMEQQMQEKTTSVAAVDRNIHKGKSKILRYNTACTNPVKIDVEDLEDVKTFTYLGSIIDEQGGSDADVKARIDKERAAYLQLRNIWNSKQLSTNTKVRIFNKMSRQFYCMGQKHGELRKSSSRRYRYYHRQSAMKVNNPDPNRGTNHEESLEMDRTHIEECTQLRHKANP
ncbi:unnamed protein product [Schistosoma mattheei]|uniref:Uncharacterized protein n=1 Tax=Schistosoma mattheei TaxID=31246 RepID=A0A183PAK6_9TREM|nr:unnamed protein product [Schistosoma mattheei]